MAVDLEILMGHRLTAAEVEQLPQRLTSQAAPNELGADRYFVDFM